MAVLPGAVLIPALRRLDIAAFQVVGTCTAEPGRLHGPGYIHQSCEQPTEALPLRMEKTPMRIRWPLCCNRLSVSDIRNCPQRFSESLALRTLGSRAAQNVPSALWSAWYRDSGALQYRVRGAPVPTTRNHGINYPPNRQASTTGLGRSCRGASLSVV